MNNKLTQEELLKNKIFFRLDNIFTSIKFFIFYI